MLISMTNKLISLGSCAVCTSPSNSPNPNTGCLVKRSVNNSNKPCSCVARNWNLTVDSGVDVTFLTAMNKKDDSCNAVKVAAY